MKRARTMTWMTTMTLVLGACGGELVAADEVREAADDSIGDAAWPAEDGATDETDDVDDGAGDPGGEDLTSDDDADAAMMDADDADALMDTSDADAALMDVDDADAAMTDPSDANETMTDADDADENPDAGCVEGDPCVFSGYLPPCYQARCNALAACVAERVPGCCLADEQCPPPVGGACTTVRCLQRTCTELVIPGCCEDASACDDGLAATTDACVEPAARCAQCAPPCPERTPLLRATFDDPGTTPATLGFVIADGQPNDAVTWQRTTERFAAGGGALYLGDPRCRTYYGGALDAACAPRDPSGQDSGRVQVGLYTPVLSLPADSPAMLTAWVRAAVEPLNHLGPAEPDVLRVHVEPLGVAAATLWEVASSLDLGKSTDWAPLAVDLAPWRGQVVRVRFELDTLDGEDNLHEGVWLDEITVSLACADGGCCDDDLDCGPPTACTRGACITTVQGGARLCAEVPATPGQLCTPCASDEACADLDPCTHDVCMPSGSCANTTFCCLERDLLAEDFETSLGAIAVVDPDPSDGVAWYRIDGAAWFGDPLTGHYAAAGPVRGTLVTPPIELPAILAPRQSLRMAMTVRLSTEWDLAAEPDPLGPLDNPAGLDRLSVEVVDGTFRTEVWSSDRIGGTTLGAPRAIAIALDPWRGRTVRVEVHFDSGDETLNTFAGAFIDALAIGLVCDAPPD